MVNIKVAVRIRPLSHRELIQKDDVIVRKENKSILVTDSKISEGQDGDSRQRTRRFAVDFCYDPSEPEGSSQEAVFQEIGVEVLDSMFHGYNACVLAYGHSASGKTYTIMGLQDDPGLAPRLCQRLFEEIESKSSFGKIRFNVLISFLEIYNEKVRDLLGSEESGGASNNFSLRVREHPKLGPYVQGLSEHLVKNKRTLLGLLAAGNKRRITAATENNVHSSRSHAVFTIHFKQSDGENYETEKSSKVHLVDLAGSLQEQDVPEREKLNERANSSQSKSRLKEGANINKSLVTLGNVISALADGCDLSKEHYTSKTWQPFVPYRDSVLTWLLKDTLGGNSNTIMIATVSPASGCFNETINTLRYAKRTKRIVNQPTINEDPKIRTIRELKEEISRLRDLLTCLQSCREEVAVSETASGRALDATEKVQSFLSKWPDSGGAQLTNGNENFCTENSTKKLIPEKEEEVDESGKIVNQRLGGVTLAHDAKSSERPRRLLGAASLGGSVCEIDDVKESDVNGSVIDNFLHETDFFSDSLESFSSFFLKNDNLSDAANDDPVTVAGYGREGGKFFSPKSLRCSKRSSRFCPRREFNSCENLRKKNLTKMLHRNRPDLIKGISSRSKDGLPSASSLSCTDVSNLSQSTSENSLNSSGSMDNQLPENRAFSGGIIGGTSKGAEREGEEQSGKRGVKSESFHLVSKKKDKRSEIVEAVTTRLYVSKKKSDRRVDGCRKEEDEDDGEVEELKLCKRARMKLFDLSRKLAMTRRIKKTVDNDTQTDFVNETVRVKEKCILTDPSGISCGTSTVPEENAQEEKKACVIMNQVFIPQNLNCVVECGRTLRIGTSETASRNELGTQTSPEKKSYKNANTSPVKIILPTDDSFSDDSLDSEERTKIFTPAISAEEVKLPQETLTQEYLDPNLASRRYSRNYLVDSVSGRFIKKEHLSCDSETTMTEISENPSENPKETTEFLFNNLPLSILTGEILPTEAINWSTIASENSLSSDSKKEENFSSENSIVSTEGTDGASSSETSTEDFVFYDNAKDKDSGNKSKARQTQHDLELYTITENSEQSDPSDAFSPLQTQRSCLNTSEKDARQYSQTENKCRIRKSEKNSFSTSSFFIGDKEIKERLASNNESQESENKVLRGECLSSGATHSGVSQRKNFLGSLISRLDLVRGKPCELSVPNSDKDSSMNVGKVPIENMVFPNGAFELSKDKVKEARALAGSVRKPTVGPDTPKSKQMYWADLHNSHKQFINLNILNSSKESPFSVDSHLFWNASRIEESTDPLFTSADSITFVFMGPAKPKTSVLMEIIKRSLEKGASSSAESCTSHRREAKNRGVQCDSSLFRSVSVDTAMIALSHIAKNQDPTGGVHRASSLGEIPPGETQATLGRGRLHEFQESGCQCDLESVKSQEKDILLTASDRPAIVQNEQKEINELKKGRVEEVENPKESISWCGEIKDLKASGTTEEAVQPHFDLSYCGTPELEVDEANKKKSNRKYSSQSLDPGLHERRVRFEKADIQDTEMPCSGRESESMENMSAFLREATLLLKNLNQFSSKHQIVPSDISDQLRRTLQNEQEHENSKGSLRRRLKKPVFLTRSGTEICLENASPVERSKTGPTTGEYKYQDFGDLTWPRRRATSGKPPTGARLRFVRSPFLPSFNCNCFSDSVKNVAPSSKMWSNGANWNSTSNCSVALSHYSFSAGEVPARAGNGRLVGSNDYRDSRDSSFLWSSKPSPRIVSSRPSTAKANVDSLLELEIDLAESCRRLELLAEQDKIRQDILETRRDLFDDDKEETRRHFPGDRSEEDSLNLWAIAAPMEVRKNVVKRRKTDECTGGCTCSDRVKNSYSCLRSKACRSNLELDSFGPGSKHCPQLCLFCHKKNAEIYSSALSLNSECCYGRCRLNYYGYCPCSPFKLSRVTVSPRAYMHHLLTLRKHIIGQAKR